ncbi:MAG: Beta-galactosidase C-terminal domain, partial [Lachnospiraceae bacterium]|nr:Beta-galactosidase C-terminal domain [Lachnospiraceae bacterium]
YGKGKAYYICADAEQGFYDELYRGLCGDAGIKGPLACELPDGVEVATRESEEAEFIFIQNYTDGEVKLPVSVKEEGYEVIFRSREASADEKITLQRFNTVVLKKIL